MPMLSPMSPEAAWCAAVEAWQAGDATTAAPLFRQAAGNPQRRLVALLNYGSMLYVLRRAEEAEVVFAGLVAEVPHIAQAHTNLAFARFLQGHFAAGWPEWEWRFPAGVATPPPDTLPRWDGIAGRRVWLWLEQGMGDTLHFLRYATLARARGITTLIAGAPRPLQRLLALAEGIDQVIAAAVPPPGLCDAVVPLLSLPWLCGRSEDAPTTLPPPVRFHLPHAAVEQAGRYLARALPLNRPRIGLVWQGRTEIAGRNVPPVLMHRITGWSGADYISLQAEDVPAAVPEGIALHPLRAHSDFLDTAALIRHLDLVISVDTAVAHLAASLGVPTWILTRYDGCWRWLRTRADSVWYPAVRLFRQPAPGDWHTVLADIRLCLEREGREIGAMSGRMVENT